MFEIFYRKMLKTETTLGRSAFAFLSRRVKVGRNQRDRIWRNFVTESLWHRFGGVLVFGHLFAIWQIFIVVNGRL